RWRWRPDYRFDQTRQALRRSPTTRDPNWRGKIPEAANIFSAPTREVATICVSSRTLTRLNPYDPLNQKDAASNGQGTWLLPSAYLFNSYLLPIDPATSHARSMKRSPPDSGCDFSMSGSRQAKV